MAEQSETSVPTLPAVGFVRLADVLKLIPVGKSAWYAGIKEQVSMVCRYQGRPLSRACEAEQTRVRLPGGRHSRSDCPSVFRGGGINEQ